MARNVSNRLEQLTKRRKGLDRLGRLALDEQLDVINKSTSFESWKKRASNQPYTRYALGSMQEVGPEYTRICLETAERVGNQLSGGLAAKCISAAFRLQGSVPLNVHIRGVSDVDLLTLDAGFYTYDRTGSWSAAGFYTSPSARTSMGVLSTLRTECETILKSEYPAASGGKAVNISGGSLARPVDVVPSHWHDTVTYQASGQEHDRAVTILDKKVP